jgi:hypothetical protein
MAELAGRSVILKVSGAATAMTGEATTTADNKIYQITTAAHRCIDWVEPLTVLDNGVATTERYSVNYPGGRVTFETVDAGRGPITLTGKYRPLVSAAYANAYSDTRECELLDITVFLDTYRSRMAGLKSASGTLTQIDATDVTYHDALTAGEPIFIEIVASSGIEPDRFMCLLNSSQITAAISDLQKNVVSWTSTDAWIRLGV